MGGIKSRDPFRDRRDGTRGAALVEMALILPLLVLITIGIFTSARAWNIHNVLDHASREAARYGAVAPDDLNAIETVAEGVVLSASYAWGNVDPCISIIRDGGVVDGTGTPQPCISGSDDPTTDDRVQVALQLPYTLNFVFFQPDITMRAQAVARLEP